MKIYPLSDKCLDALCDSDYKINFFVGAVRAGKTFISVLRWIRFITTEVNPGELVAITGKSTNTIERNIISLIKEFAGPENVTYRRAQGELYIYGIKHMVAGADNEKSQEKIQGSTLKGALCDEVTLYPESFINMLLTRLSIAGAKTFWTANPAGPYHYLRKDFILKAAELNEGKKEFQFWDFTMDDNLSLTEDYKNSLKKTMRGVYYDRLVLGKWINAEGVIYDMYYDADVLDRDETGKENGRVLHPSHVVDVKKALENAGRSRFKHYIVGVDYGTRNPTTFVLLGYDEYDGKKFICKEYFWDSKEEKKQKVDAEYANDLIQFMSGYNVESIIVDPSAASFKAELAQKKIFTTDADNSILDGLRFVSTEFAGYNLLIDKNCNNIRRELQVYSWDEKLGEKGVDHPILKDDHTMDAIRYILYTTWGKYQQGLIAGYNRA